MSRPDGMQEVELADAAPAAGPGPGDAVPDEDAARRRRRRRAVLRWWPAAVVAVVAVAGSQVVLDARERARVDRAREQPGVVGYDVRPDLAARPVDPGDVPRAGVDVGDHRVLAAEVVPGEPRAVHAVDATSGDEVWRTVVEDVGLAAELGSRDYPQCWAGDPPVEQVLCFVQDIPTRDLGDGAYEVDPPVRSRLLTLDAGTGALVGERELAPRAHAVVVGGDLLRAEVVADGVRVVAEDLASGDVRWSAEPPVDARALDGVPDVSPYVWATGAHVVVQLSQQSWSLDRADGRVEVTGSGVSVGRDERLITTAMDDGLTRLHGADGSGDVLAVGMPVTLGVDDGSVPGLDLLSDVDQGDRRVRAVDPSTGAQVWEHVLVGPAEATLTLLDDVLYGADGGAVWAIDARDGTEVWRTSRDPGAGDVAGSASAGDWLRPVTDGRQLLLVEPEGDPRSVLRAWSLASGALQWSVPLPDEAAGWVGVWDGALVGLGLDPVLLR